MNINAIKRNCAKREKAVIYNAIGHRGQWISDGRNAFRVDGLKLDEDALAALFDLSDKKRRAWNMGERIETDPRFSAVLVEGEEDTDAVGAQVYCDEVFLALPSRRGLLYIPFDSVRHIKEDKRRYAVRWANDRPLVAVYGDLTCSVLVLPAPDEEALTLQRLAGKMAGSPYMWEHRGMGDEADAATAEDAAEAMIRQMEQADGEAAP